MTDTTTPADAAFRQWYFEHGEDFNAAHVRPVWMAAWQARAASQPARNEWKEAIIEKLIVSHIYRNEHEDDAEKAINDLLSWEVEIALDPRVSSDAQALIDRGRAEASQPAQPCPFGCTTQEEHDAHYEKGPNQVWEPAQEPVPVGRIETDGTYTVFAAPPSDTARADRKPSECGYCTYEEADGSLIEQCKRCKAIDAALEAEVRKV